MLDINERARLAQELIESLDAEPSPDDVEAQWIAEALRRVELVDRGEMSPMSAEDVHAGVPIPGESSPLRHAMPHRSADGLRYSSAAVMQLRAQLKHYARTSPDLDLLFADAVRQAGALAVGNPEGFARVFDDADLRVIVIRRFPFKLF